MKEYCRNTLTDLYRFSPRDLERIDEPFKHTAISSLKKDLIEGKVTIKFDGVYYWRYIAIPRARWLTGDQLEMKNAYADAIMEAMTAIYRELPLSEPFRPWHWHEWSRP